MDDASHRAPAETRAAPDPGERTAPAAGTPPPDEDAPLGGTLWRGWRMRCPRCGEGRMLRAYLKVRDACPRCGEALHHARADDGPAYLTILVVGHVMAPAILLFYPAFRPSPLVTATVFSVLCVALSLALLPRFKGIIVAVQWRSRLGGFDGRSPAR